MAIAKLDRAFCASAVCEPGKKKTDYTDTEIKGFLLEVRSSGGKTYHFKYTDQHRKTRQVKISAWEDVTFAVAKRRAQERR